jgi:hypothetical protein
MTTRNPIAARHQAETVDKIGALKAALAPQLKELKRLEGVLKDVYGVGRYQGDLFEANVFAGERNSLDMDAVRAKLTPQFIRAHTTTTETITVKVTARQLSPEALAA